MPTARVTGSPALRDLKVQVRLRPSQKAIIQRAAQARQTTLSAFIVQHAVEAASDVLVDQVHFSLSEKKWREFCAAMDAPTRDRPELRNLLTTPSVLDLQK